MNRGKWLGLLVLGLVLLVGTPQELESSCPVIEGVSQQGQPYRLDGVCVSTEQDQLNAMMGDDWKLSVWTGEMFMPIVAVVYEYRWSGSSKVELSFLTLDENVNVDITKAGLGNS